MVLFDTPIAHRAAIVPHSIIIPSGSV